MLHRYLPEGAPSYGEMTVAEFLDFIADVRGLTGERRRERRDVVIERLGLGPVIDQLDRNPVQRIPAPRRTGTGV